MAKKKSEISQAGARVQETLAKLDVDMVGVARVHDLKGTRLGESTLKLMPAAHSIVVLGMEVYPEFLDLTSPERTMGTANLNDLYRRHTDILAGRLTGAAYNVARESRQA